MFDYLPADGLLMVADAASVERKIRLVRGRIGANYQEAAEKRTAALPPDELFLSEPEYAALLSKRLSARFSTLPDPEGVVEALTLTCSDHGLLAQEIELQRKKRGLLAPSYNFV